MALAIPDAAGSNIVAMIDLVVMRPGATVSDCAAFADIPEQRAAEALAAAELLGLVRQDGQGHAALDWRAEMLAAGSVDQKRQVIRAQLERFEPYAYVRLRMIQGFDILQACREARVRFDIENQPAVIRDVFSNWGLYARSLVGDPPTPDTSLGIDSPLAAVIDPILATRNAVEEFVSDALTPALYIGLDQAIRDNLLLGVRRFLNQEEPRSVGQPLGIAFEDYLRSVAQTVGVDVSTKNGITEVGMELRTQGAIAKKHIALIQSVGAIRIAIEHGIDADEGQEWQITTQGLRLLVATVMLAIKSISSYVEHGALDM
jgi:hypothetical protein